MSKIDRKSKLYVLIRAYLEDQIDEKQFSLEFHRIYHLSLNYNDLSMKERSVFLELALMTEKVLSPDVRIPDEKSDDCAFRQLHNLISKTKKRLSDSFDTVNNLNENIDLENFDQNYKALKENKLNRFKKNDRRRLYELIYLS